VFSEVLQELQDIVNDQAARAEVIEGAGDRRNPRRSN
jgi:hypothetical protein